MDKAIYHTHQYGLVVQAVANPTLSTISRVQDVLQEAGEPISRYEIHKRLGGKVNYPVLEAALNYFVQLRVIVDEGSRGKVLWVHNPGARSLFESSRRVA